MRNFAIIAVVAFVGFVAFSGTSDAVASGQATVSKVNARTAAIDAALEAAE